MKRYKQMPDGMLDTEKELYITEESSGWAEFQTWMDTNTADVFDFETELPMDELSVRGPKMARITEDLIAVLLDKGLVSLDDFPEHARDVLVERKHLASRIRKPGKKSGTNEGNL